MNDENLIPFSERTESEQREIRRKGGIASGEARRKKVLLRGILEKALPMPEKNDQIKEMMRQAGWIDEEITQAVVVVQGLLMQAKKGDVAAFNAIRDLNGEKPVEEINNTLTTDVTIGFVHTDKELASDEDEIED